MAKFQSTLSLREMEERLGFTANSMTPPNPATKQFYCDLKLVPDPTKQLFREYRELKKTNQPHHRMVKTSLVLPKMGGSLVIEDDGNRAVIKRIDRVGFYIYSIDISYNGGFSLQLLFTETEATWAISATKFPAIETPQDDSPFLKLPRELREKVYGLALPQRELGIKNVDAFDDFCFPAAVGDPSGFLFQLGEEPAILRVSRQIRQEALPFAYRNTTYCLDDMDDVVKVLVAAGHIGRSNITSLQFPWTSKNEIECRLEQYPHADDSGPILPSLHALRCIQLLKECPRLQLLRICLDQDIFQNVSACQFMADPGIAGLCTLKGIRTVEVVDYSYEPLEEHPTVKQLHERMKKANR